MIQIIQFFLLTLVVVCLYCNAFQHKYRKHTARKRVWSSQLQPHSLLLHSIDDTHEDPSTPTTDTSSDLESLFNRIQNMNPEDIPVDVRNSINEQILKDAPDDMTMRMRMLGITPFTIAGYALAAILITLNITLGNGWASELFGLNDDGANSQLFVSSSYPSINNKIPSSSMNGNGGNDMYIEMPVLKLNNKENIIR